MIPCRDTLRKPVIPEVNKIWLVLLFCKQNSWIRDCV